MKKIAIALIGLLSATPAHAWMASDTDTAIGIAGGIASMLGAIGEQSAREEAVRNAQAAQVIRATENDFANIIDIYVKAGWKAGFACNTTVCSREFRLNTRTNGYFIAYENTSKADGSIVRYVCWRSIMDSPVPMRCYNTLGSVSVLPKNVEAAINNTIDQASKP